MHIGKHNYMTRKLLKAMVACPLSARVLPKENRERLQWNFQIKDTLRPAT